VKLLHGEPGTNAEVTYTETGENELTLTFTIPRGKNGMDGDGAVTYTAGTGIEITNDNVINCTITPGTGDGISYTAGNGIKIDGNVISCTVTPGQTYTAGTGIKIEGNVISCTVEPTQTTTYSGSDNISISSTGVINVTDKVALKTDIKTYTAGTGIKIEDNVISCTVTPGSGSTYTAGNGISIADDNEISIKGVQHFDEPQDGFIGLYTDADGLHFTTNLIVTKAELSQQLGDINSILDEINGEVL
jgi:hypothetical protein